MTFLQFWAEDLSEQEARVIQRIEQQILALENEWLKYDEHNFTDWNVKFRKYELNDIGDNLKIPLDDSKEEKKEFKELWHETIELFRKTIKLIEKKKTKNAVYIVFSKIREFEDRIIELENEERRTITYLRTHYQVFKPFFDKNFGKGYYEDQVMINYEIRFKILQILQREYELIRYLLSDFS